MNNGVPAVLLPHLDAWLTPQVGLDEVPRWKKYIDKDQGVRLQNSLQHSLSITILGSMMMARLRPYGNIDSGFVVISLALHDVGEGILKKDTLYIDKTAEQDLNEYLAFRRHYEPLGNPVFPVLNEAFLLQFARKSPDIFPEDARQVMTHLAKYYLPEALMFDAVERWDYVLYAIEQYHKRGNEKILVQVLRTQAPLLDQLAKEISGFGEEIWTQEIGSWARAFVIAHEGLWIEQKGEV